MALSTAAATNPPPPTFAAFVTCRTPTGLKLRVYQPAIESADEHGTLARHPMIAVKKDGQPVLHFAFVAFAGVIGWADLLLAPTLDAYNLRPGTRDNLDKRFVIQQAEVKALITFTNDRYEDDPCVHQDPRQITVRLSASDHRANNDPETVVIRANNDEPQITLTADEFRDLFSVCQHQARLVGVVCPGYSLPAISYTNVGI